MKKILILVVFLFVDTMLFAQNKDNANIVGTYNLVLVDNILADGSRVHLYGDDPKGILMLDSAGHYSLQIFSNGRPKFAAADKSKGTNEENTAAVKGSNTHYGTYVVDKQTQTITFNIEHATFPNWEGTTQKRPLFINGIIIKYTVPSPTTGGNVTGEVEWKKIE